MTLGEFRKLTEQYQDECEVRFATSGYQSLAWAEPAKEIIIRIDNGTDTPPDIILMT